MEKSFIKHADRFWQAFLEREEELRGFIDRREDPEKAVQILEELFSICFGQTFFQIGFSEEVQKYELIATPEGNYMLLPGLFCWYLRTPRKVLEKWRVHYAKPAELVDDDVNLQMHGTVIDNDLLRIYVEPDKEAQKFHMQVYCENFAKITQEQAYQMLFIYFGNLIGELFVMENIGEIVLLAEDKGKGTLVETEFLGEFMEETMAKEKWNCHNNPLGLYTSYQMRPNEAPNFAKREDIFIGYTRLVPLIQQFLNEESEQVIERKKDGIHFGYLCFDNTFLPREKVVEFRTELEDTLEGMLEGEQTAFLLGGATGYRYSYIDVCVFDWAVFLDKVRTLSKVRGLPFVYADFYKGALELELEAKGPVS